VGLVPKFAADGSDPRVILESRTRNGMYLGWKGKLPETGDKLSMGVLDIKAMGVDSRKRAQVIHKRTASQVRRRASTDKRQGWVEGGIELAPPFI
jgi:hypothetical protein